PERQALRRLSVFVAGCTLEAAEVVCGGEGLAEEDVLGLVSQLVNKSLVRGDKNAGGPRYRLPAAIRQYARDRPGGGDEAGGGGRGGGVLGWGERGERERPAPGQVEWLDRLESEIDNLRAALEWSDGRRPAELGMRLAGALGWLWVVRDYWSEGRDWLRRALA